MSEKHRKLTSIKPLSAAIGAAFVTSLAFAPTAIAADNPFEMQELDSGYMVAGGGDKDKDEEGKCGEGKCGGDKDKDKDEEGKCGGDKDKEGSCGGDKDKDEEGKCGEGKCGAA